MTTETSTSLRLSRMIKADPDAVFRAWTDPAQLKQWSSPEGAEVAEAQVDLVVGGRYRLRMKNPEGVFHTAVGVYREIDRPHRLRYTWQWEEKENDVGETLVTVDFTEAAGATEVTITHELFPNGEAKEAHEQGWGSCLNRLERVFA